MLNITNHPFFNIIFVNYLYVTAENKEKILQSFCDGECRHGSSPMNPGASLDRQRPPPRKITKSDGCELI